MKTTNQIEAEGRLLLAKTISDDIEVSKKGASKRKCVCVCVCSAIV